MADQKILNNRQKVLERIISFKKYLDSYAVSPNSLTLRLRYQQILEDYNEYEKAQNAIEAKTDATLIEAEIAKRIEIENEKFELLSKAQEILENVAKGTVENPLDPSRSNSIDSTPSPNRGNTPINVDLPGADLKLPKFDLPKFSGSYEAWPGFVDAFRGPIHESTRISNVQKLMYLRSCLNGKAAEKIESLPTTDANYTVAWNLLKKSYDDPNVLINKHIKGFFELPACTKTSAESIGELAHLARKHYRALEALQQSFLECFPIYAVISKLDDESRLKWKEVRRSGTIPTMEELLEFIHDRAKLLEDEKPAQSNKPHASQNSGSSNNKPRNQRSYSAQVNVRTPYCHMCKADHYTQNCEQIVNCNIDERETKIKEHKLCFNCLRANHAVKDCKSKGCKKCNKQHHTLLHRDTPNNQSANVQSNLACLYSSYSNQMLLSTAQINFSDLDGNLYKARILLDSCSQANFITKDLADKLNLPRYNVNVSVTGINDNVTHYRNVVHAKFQSRVNDYSNELEFLVRDKFPDVVPAYYIKRDTLRIPVDKPLADPDFHSPSTVDGIIGTEIYLKLLRTGQRTINDHGAVMQNTVLGWIIAGKIPTNQTNESLICNFASIETINHNMQRFWEIEEIPKEKCLSIEEKECEEHFTNNTTRDGNPKRYIVRLPINENKNKLGASYNTALKQLYSLERSFDKNAKLKEQYVEFMDEYENLDHMTQVKLFDTNGFAMPHHAIHKLSSLTTKTRVVYDASRKTSNGLSLNDILMKGPVIQDDLLSIILRFRIYHYVLTADIAKMYRQILVHPDDRKYQQILWRKDKNEPVKIYQLDTLTYGTTSASFLATRVLQQLAEDEGAAFPLAARVLKTDFYMDDLLTGSQSLSHAKTLRDELIDLTAKGGFCLRQWASNVPELVSDLSDDADNSHISLNLDETIKTLGLFWNPKHDKIMYTVKNDDENCKITKRSILSQIAKLFDPLGLLGPVIVVAKILMQQLWQLKLDWDEPLPADISNAWQSYINDLNCIQDLKINRKVTVDSYSNLEIHGFADASEKAYGACVFIRSTNSDGQVAVQLLCAKSKVAPLKSVSLPRLELCAALLLARLYETVKTAMRDIKISKATFWSDSTITLHWLNTQPHTLKTFVSNRVAEIQGISSPEQWRHVPSEDNPADLISRGLAPRDFISNQLWKNGPTWLQQEESAWPKTNLQFAEIPERKPVASFAATIKKNDLIERYSSLTKLKRIVAYGLRFAYNGRVPKIRRSGPLSAADIQEALNTVIQVVQQERFSKEISILSKNQVLNGNLASLSPFLDKDKIMRVGGRLEHSNLPYQQKHQALLPKNHHITDLIIRETHQQNMHAGTQATLNLIREQYWIVDGRQYIKKILHKCVLCRRAKPTIPQYPMGNLPKDRVEFSRPFLKTGVDYCGPFFIKEKRVRNRNKIKVYVAIFVCLSTKAVHIELVEDLSTQAFLAALRRFFARRGKSTDLYSDNATNFVGAKRELDELHKFISSSENSKIISNELANQNINWHFIPPRSPHFGGLWEAAVKSFKHHVIRVIGSTLLSIEAFLTYVVEIEAILNSRPIIPLSSDPNDLKALTPGHFLIGEPLTSMPEHDLRELQPTRLASWEKAKQMRQHFWSRWYKEYLHTQTIKKKWHTGQAENVTVGTLVVMKEDNVPPMQWNLARITKLYPGPDGITRVVSVKTTSGEYKRAIKNLSPLPIDIKS